MKFIEEETSEYLHSSAFSKRIAMGVQELNTIYEDIQSALAAINSTAINSAKGIAKTALVELKNLKMTELESQLKEFNELSEQLTTEVCKMSMDSELRSLRLKKLYGLYNGLEPNMNVLHYLAENRKSFAAHSTKSITAVQTVADILVAGKDSECIRDSLRKTLEQFQIEKDALIAFNPPVEQMILKEEEELEKLRIEIQKLTEFKAIRAKLVEINMAWTASLQESTSLDKLLILHDTVSSLEEDYEIAKIRRRKRSRQQLENESDQITTLNAIVASKLEFEAELLRLTKLANSFFPEILPELDQFMRSDDKMDEMFTFGRSIHSYSQVDSLCTSGSHLIFKASFRDEPCALKRFEVGTDRGRKRFMNAVKTLRKINHGNIIKVKAAFVENEYGYLEVPYYANGDLASYFLSHSAMKDMEKQFIGHQILLGLDCLHRMNIIHCDLKPQNILVGSDNQIVIGDFDICRDEEFGALPVTTTIAGTWHYFPPDATLTKKSDLFSFGLILYDMHFPPIDGKFERPFGSMIVEDIAIPETEIIHLRDILTHLLKFKPEDRLDMNQALFHPYFTTPLNPLRDSQTDRRHCMICFEDFWLDEGLECSNHHFACISCFRSYVCSLKDLDMSIWRERKGQMICIFTNCTFVHQPNHFSALLDEESYQTYTQKMLDMKEAEVTDELSQVFDQRLKALEKESTEMIHVRKIQEEILNLTCPRCKIVFVDFDACFALKCRNCQCAFCAWCLQDCGANAHLHVRRCQYSLSNGELYGTIDQFQTCHKNRKKRLIEAYLNGLPSEELKASVKDHLKQELNI